MKTSFYSLFLLTAVCTSYTPVKSTYTLTKDYAVTIHGTSNLHNWDEKVEQASGTCSISPTTKESVELEKLSILLDVHSIKSDMGIIMNDNTYKALKADQYPTISFVLNTPVNGIDLLPGNQKISAKGILTIAGISKAIDMLVMVDLTTENKITIEGSQLVKMSDYHIEAPTALMGTLKTGDEIIIHFKTSFEPATH